MKKNEHNVIVTIEKEEWTKALDDSFKKKNANTTVKGFRKGKAPKEVYLKEYGIESLFMEAADLVLPSAYKKAIEDNNLVPVCEPRVDIKGIDENHIELEFNIITKPEIKVSSYKNLDVKKETPKVSKKEIEDEILSLQNRFAEIIEKENGAVENGDIAVIDFEGFVDGKAFEGGKGTDYSLEIGSGTFIPGFEEQVIGQKVSETKDINVKFPDEYVADLAGKDAVFKVTVKKIKTRVLPELNKEFFQDLGYEDVNTKEELETKVKEHILEHKNEDAENKYIDALIAAGVKNVEVDLNDEIVHDELHRMIDELAQKLQMQGITLEQYFGFTNLTMEKFEENSKPAAIERIKSRYLLDYIIENEKLTSTDEEIKEHAKKQADKYGMEESELIQMYGGLEYVKYDLLIHKAIEVLKK